MDHNVVEWLPADLGQRVAGWGTKFAASVLIFLGFLIASAIVRKLINRFGTKADPQRQEILTLIGSIARIALLVFGVVTALGTLGINVSALVAGLGLTGFALGFAFRDALSNVLAGLMILMYRPFRRGDLISVTGLEGEVTGIDLRYTTLQTEGRTFLLPNSMLLTNAITLKHE
jgi:small-conductance mechanosensitive channel